MTLPTAVASGRVNVAFDDDTLEPSPSWTRLDNIPGLVASYTIDRGRQFELDRTDGGRASVQIVDRNGLLDPTNTTGTYYTKIEPLIQVVLGRFNPILSQWQTRFRGFVDEWDYSFDPSQNFNVLTLELLDIFEILQSVQMVPGIFGEVPPSTSVGQVVYNVQDVNERINDVYADLSLPSDFYVTFTGNVELYQTIYSPGESALTALQEACDAEFPGISNLYPDRFGRSVFHGRLAKFDPATVSAGAGAAAWDWHHWYAGDQAAVAAAPTTHAHIRRFGFERGLSKIYNQALATPLGIADADVEGQIVDDPTSIALRGIRSWSAQNLLTKRGLLDSSTALVECARFALNIVTNYKDPHNRVSTLTFRSMRTGQTGAAPNWKLLCEVDISDRIDITVDSPGGGGLNLEPFYVEGIHETNEPLNDVYDDVTVSLDVSPIGVYSNDTTDPFPTS